MRDIGTSFQAYAKHAQYTKAVAGQQLLPPEALPKVAAPLNGH